MLNLCTATGNLDHSHNQDYLTERNLWWRDENAEDLPPILKRRSFWRPSAMKVHKRSCVGEPHNLSEDQLSQWKYQLVENAVSLLTTTDKHSSEAPERVSLGERICWKSHLHAQERRSLPQWLCGHSRSERSHWTFYHSGVSPETPTFGVRVFDTYGIWVAKLGCGLTSV